MDSFFSVKLYYLALYFFGHDFTPNVDHLLLCCTQPFLSSFYPFSITSQWEWLKSNISNWPKSKPTFLSSGWMKATSSSPNEEGLLPYFPVYRNDTLVTPVQNASSQGLLLPNQTFLYNIPRIQPFISTPTDSLFQAGPYHFHLEYCFLILTALSPFQLSSHPCSSILYTVELTCLQHQETSEIKHPKIWLAIIYFMMPNTQKHPYAFWILNMDSVTALGKQTQENRLK